MANSDFVVVLWFIIGILAFSKIPNEGHNEALSTEPAPDIQMSPLSEKYVDMALGEWRTVYVNAQWTTEECEVVSFARPSLDDTIQFRRLHPELESEKLKLKFIQDGAMIAALLETDLPGVYTTVPAGDVGDSRDEFISLQYIALGEEFMLVKDLSAVDVDYTLVLSRRSASVDAVREHLNVVGVAVFNVTGCVEGHDQNQDHKYDHEQNTNHDQIHDPDHDEL